MLTIDGGVPLHGSVAVSGAKNAALPIMAASILAEGPVTLRRVPRLTDVATLSRVLDSVGVGVRRYGGDRLWIETVEPSQVRASRQLVSRMRASFCVLGPLLARRGRAVVPLPGGCAIGPRPVDLHLRGLAALGAEIGFVDGHCVARARRLKGAMVDMAGPRGSTVTGTANVMSAAVLARGTTVIHGAALEPEIVDLGRFLIALGAQITGLGTSTVEIRGVDALGAAEYAIIPDRVEAATLLLAGAVTGGAVTVNHVAAHHLESVLAMLDQAGVALDVGRHSIRAVASAPLRPISICARPYPGLPTDVQAQFTVLAALARGRSVVRDAVFPDRFAHVRELRRFGANVRRANDGLEVSGARPLHGARVRATDLRASAALVLAGLAAEGRSTVLGTSHLVRGYDGLDAKLRSLGANVATTPLGMPLALPAIPDIRALAEPVAPATQS